MAKVSVTQQLAASQVLVEQLKAEATATREMVAKLMAGQVQVPVVPQPVVPHVAELRSTLYMGRKITVGEAVESFDIKDKTDEAERTAKGQATFKAKALVKCGIHTYAKHRTAEERTARAKRLDPKAAVFTVGCIELMYK